MDGSGSSWMTLLKASPHRYKYLPKSPDSKGTVIYPVHLHLIEHKHFSTLQTEHNPFFIFHVHGAVASGWMRHGELG